MPAFLKKWITSLAIPLTVTLRVMKKTIMEMSMPVRIMEMSMPVMITEMKMDMTHTGTGSLQRFPMMPRSMERFLISVGKKPLKKLVSVPLQRILP